MLSSDNKEIVQRFFAVLNDGEVERLGTEVLAPDYQLHFDGLPPMDRAGAQQFFGAFLSAFPDLHHAIEDQIAEGHRVATRIVVRGTHQAPFQGLPPTGKEIAIGGINIHVIADRKIVEQWVNGDALGMMQQLGVISQPEQART